MTFAAAGDHLLRHRVAVSIALGMVVALILRAPWHDAALGRDEGGVAMVARAWHGGGPFAYGSYFLDRPPLLVALYRLAGDGDAGIRALGAVAALLLVSTSTLLAVRIGGRRAAPWAAGIAAVFASSSAIKTIYTPAELLAVVPSSASVLLLLIALERKSRRLWVLAGAGALAAAALLVKQSFGDALVAGAVALVVGKALGLSWRETARRAGAYFAGVSAVIAGLVAWAALSHTSAAAVWYAMFGFRIDSVAVLVNHGLESRLSTLGSPLLASGLGLALALAVVAMARLRGRPLVRITFAAWMSAAVAGILLGGSYWPHYLIALVPGAAAGAAVILRRNRWVGALAVAAIALPTAINAAGVARSDSADGFQQGTIAIGDYISDRSLPDQTAYAMYAKVNVLYYAGLRVPYPYNWSLMVRAVPGAQQRLRSLLASPKRPTWIVRAEGPHAFGLDTTGATKRLLTQHYRAAGTVCGTRVLLARGARAHPAPSAASCA
jgi:4-amino-4-deoxy-L-arabinose transferase-like glycosyltransferase